MDTTQSSPTKTCMKIEYVVVNRVDDRLDRMIANPAAYFAEAEQRWARLIEQRNAERRRRARLRRRKSGG